MCVCVCRCVCVCVRVRAVRRTQGLTLDDEAMRAETARLDPQGQTLLHIIAHRGGRDPGKSRTRADRTSPIQMAAHPVVFCFPPQPPPRNAWAFSGLTLSVNPSPLPHLAAASRLQFKLSKGFSPHFLGKARGKQRSKFPSAARGWRRGSVQRENPEGVEGGVV